MLWALALAISVSAVLISVILFHTGLQGIERKYRNMLIWAILFLGVSFGNLEWAFYLLGYNLFTFFAFPLIAYFAIWFGFIIWVFERIGERKMWIAFLATLIILTIIALSCMNCLATYSLT